MNTDIALIEEYDENTGDWEINSYIGLDRAGGLIYNPGNKTLRVKMIEENIKLIKEQN